MADVLLYRRAYRAEPRRDFPWKKFEAANGEASTLLRATIREKYEIVE